MRRTIPLALFALVVVLFLALLCIGSGWIATGNDFFLYRYFAPREERVRREVFEQSKAYNQGQVQELQNMQLEYVQASLEHRTAIASIILHRAADFDPDRLPPDLRGFIDGLKRQQGLAAEPIAPTVPNP